MSATLLPTHIDSEKIHSLKQYKSVTIGIWYGLNVAIKEEQNSSNFSFIFSILSKKNHDNIAQLFGSITDKSILFSVSEYTSRGYLDNILQDSSVNLSWNTQRLNIVIDISRGLQFLHQINIIHGDLRSTNILIDENWRAKITNIGNPIISWWSAPELIIQQCKPNKSSDIYAFGMTLWEISLRNFPDEENVRKQEKIPNCPEEISNIIHLCLQSKSEDRPNSSQILNTLSDYRKFVLKELTTSYCSKEVEEICPLPGKAPYEAGKKLWELGRNGEAIPYFKEAASLGNPCAYLRLDHKTQKLPKRKFYKQKIEEHLPWFQEQAKMGDPHAIYNLALCYEMGYGDLKDPRKAIELYLKSASLNYGRGICAAGKVYSDLHEYDKAMECYKKGIEYGILLPLTSMGYCYEMGAGVPRDLSKSVKFYTMAAEKGEFTAQYNLAICYQYGQGVPMDMEKAIYWHSKAAEVNTPEACYQLGQIYKLPGFANKEKAFKYFKKAADRGNILAQNELKRWK